MTIEFHCPVCQKLLKTADDKAGVRANCPGCGQSVTVPDLVHEAAAVDSSLEPMESHRQALPSEREVVPLDSGAAASEGLAGQTKACPMCGAEIKLAAKRCRFCGEDLIQRRAQGVPARIDAGEVLSTTWGIYKKKLGVLMGSIVIVGAITIGVSIAGNLLQQAMLFAVAGFGARPGNNAVPAAIAMMGVILILMVVNIVVNIGVGAYLQAGLHVLLLRLARGEGAGVSELFRGGRYFWRFFWGTLLFQLMMGAGFMMFIIPGIILLLMFWPLFYVMVDRDEGVIDSLGHAREVTSENFMAAFVVFLAGIGIQMLGILPGGGLALVMFRAGVAAQVGGFFVGYCVALLFTLPFWAMLWAVAYCMMSGQAVDGARRA